jgi:serine/threonine protein kinase
LLVGACAACLYAVIESEEPTLPDLRVAEIDGIPPTSIAGFRLLDVLGEGGGGRVYLAEQAPPLPRVVALKLFAGVATREALARFEDEKRALARLEHPGIARIYETDRTDDGCPFIVMEYVDGEPITAFCDARGLGLDARLRLIVTVCETVEAAHRRGVLHRDLKPSNILVRTRDAKAEPVVIDFGLAKFQEGGSDLSLDGRIIGTPLYMSPEQAMLSNVDVDTRSDVYSLGVLLYELLTGSTPFEGKRLHAAAFDEMLRIIREEEPPKPSTRVSSSDTLPSVAANRHTEPARLSKDVQGELDWIVMKALEKDRNRRYETASGFAADIERHLHDEPVEAGPPSAAYRFRKFAKRNKRGMAAALAVAVMVMKRTSLALMPVVEFFTFSKRGESSVHSIMPKAGGTFSSSPTASFSSLTRKQR